MAIKINTNTVKKSYSKYSSGLVPLMKVFRYYPLWLISTMLWVLLGCMEITPDRLHSTSSSATTYKSYKWTSDLDILGGNAKNPTVYIKNIEFRIQEDGDSSSSEVFGYVSIPENSPQERYHQTKTNHPLFNSVYFRKSPNSQQTTLKIIVQAKVHPHHGKRENYVRFVLGIDKNQDGHLTMKLGDYVGDSISNEVYTFFGNRQYDEVDIMPSKREDYKVIYSSIEVPMIPSVSGKVKIRITASHSTDDSFGEWDDILGSCVNIRQGVYSGFDSENSCLNDEKTIGFLTNSYIDGNLVDTAVVLRNEDSLPNNVNLQNPLNSEFFISKVGVDVFFSNQDQRVSFYSSNSITNFSIQPKQPLYYKFPSNISLYSDQIKNLSQMGTNVLQLKLNIETSNTLIHGTSKRIIIGIDKNNDGVFRNFSHAFSRTEEGWFPSQSYEDYKKQDEIYLIEPIPNRSSITIPLDYRLLSQARNSMKVRLALQDMFDTTFNNPPLYSALCRNYRSGRVQFDDKICFVRNVDVNYLDSPNQDGNIVDFNVVIKIDESSPQDDYPQASFDMCDYIHQGKCTLPPSDINLLNTNSAPWATAVFNGYSNDKALYYPEKGRIVIRDETMPLVMRSQSPKIYMQNVGELTYNQIYFMHAHNTYEHGITKALDLGFRSVEIDMQMPFYNVDWPIVAHVGWNNYNSCGLNGESQDLQACLDRVAEWLDRDNQQPNRGWAGPITIWLDVKFGFWDLDRFHEVSQKIKRRYGERIITPNELRDWVRKKSNNPNLSLRQGIIESGWPQLKFMDGIKDNNPGGEDLGDMLFLLTGTIDQIDDYFPKEYDRTRETIMFPCIGNNGLYGIYYDALYEENRYTAHQPCWNAKWEDHIEKKFWLAEQNNLAIHTYGGKTDEFDKAYIAVAHGAQFISRDNWDHIHEGYLPFIGIRKSVPGIFRLKYQGNTFSHIPEENRCLGAEYIGLHSMWKNGIDIIMTNCNPEAEFYTLGAYSPSLERDSRTVFRYSAESQLRIGHYATSCLDIEDIDPDNGAKIHQWDCDGGDSKKWALGYDGKFYSYLDRNKYFKPNGINSVVVAPKNAEPDYYKLIPLGEPTKNHYNYLYYKYGRFYVRHND